MNIIEEINRTIGCLMAHPDNEPNSEFEDRIDSLIELREEVKNNSHLHNVSLRFLEEKIAELQSEYDKGWSNEPDDDYKRHERLGMRIKALTLAKTELFTNVC